ncbi:MAG: hypothetical protein H7A20_09745 [Rhodanobacteraceae bacterium]|nr:hypothetical protein [Rhodanobacteraceae bacterium]
MPLPTAADDHQTRNADSWSSGGAALLVAQGDAFRERLGDAVASPGGSSRKLLAMAQAARAMADRRG